MSQAPPKVGETVWVWFCEACGYCEGHTMQAGCCRQCGIAADGKRLLVQVIAE